MKARWILASVISLFVFFSVPGGEGLDPVTLKYQVDRNYPPYSYAMDGSLFGFDPYLTNILFTSNDYVLDYSTDTWDKVYPRLVSGQIDLAGIIAVTEERKKEVLFTEPLFKSFVSIYTRVDFRKIRLDDLQSLKVGVGRGYYTESLLRNTVGLDSYVAYDDIAEALDALNAGKIDAVFENQQFMDNLLIKENLKGRIVAQVTNLYPRAHAYAVSKQRPELVQYMNRRIDQLKRNGVFEEIYMKYFYTHSDSYYAIQNLRIILGVAASVIVLAVSFVLMQLLIRRLKRNLQGSVRELGKAKDDLSDAHDELIERYEEIHTIAYANSVTCLPNKNLFKETVDALIGGEGAPAFALFYLDIDSFKEINDVFGHAMGDNVLRAIASRLREAETEESKLFNLAGDEFVFLFFNAVNREDVDRRAAHIMGRINGSFAVEGNEFYITASGGVVQYPEHGGSYDELLKNADTAMYRSKALSKGTYTFFTMEMGQDVQEKNRLQSSLRKALQDDEFELYYQPQIDLRIGRINGFEALLRWNSPECGVVSPLNFIRVAEESRLILPIGDWVLASACRFIKDLNDSTGSDFFVSVNISTIQLMQETFVADVLRTLEAAELAPKYLELEITESCFLDTTSQVIAKLETVKAAGIRIALDDFGTGYSSLSYLNELPMSTLKIDRSFINSIFECQKNRSLTSSIVAIGHSLGLQVVAEGVETQEQLLYLRMLECDRLQGYLFGRPIPEEEVAGFLRHFTASMGEYVG